mgnify:CR=1 FL=1
MKPANDLLAATGTTIFTVMSALAGQHGAINLGQGFPDTDGPADVVAAAVAALQDGRNQYPPLTGVPELRAAVATANARFYGIQADPATEVVVTSGATEAITACLMALLNPGDTVLGMDLSHGGHLTHGSPVNFSGQRYTIVGYKVDTETELIDMDNVRALAHEHRPQMIIAGASAYSRVIDFAAFRAIADEVGAILFADIAHIAGLVAAGVHPSPLPHAHVVATTTHKTLRGPRSGLLLSSDQGIAAKLDRSIFPGHQGGPLEHVIAGKAIAFGEALRPEFRVYSEQVVTNARAMAAEFQSLGYRVVSGGTDNHMFVLDIRPQGLNGTKATKLLDAAHITISKSTLPYDTEKILHGGGIRIGTPAVTTRGMNEGHMKTIAGLIDRALKGEDVQAEVHAFAGGFPLP